MTHLMQTYGRLPISFVRGEGAWLTDTNGRTYLDAMAGVAVCSLGHTHPAITQAICEQAAQLLHTSNWFNIPNQEKLGERLCQLARMDTAFFANSGAEANEAAIKLARLYGNKRERKNPTIIVMEGSFHGRTLATLSASGNRRIQAGFEPLVSGFNRVPYNDIDAVRQVGEHNPDIVAVMVEPVLGEGGVVVPNQGYLQALRQICDERGWLLILDEIQTGMGRTGRWFACQHEEVRPDILTVAKALGNGIPIGACLARGEAAKLFQPGNHGTTYGGNPFACRVALAVIETMQSLQLDKRAAMLGERMLTGLRAQLNDAKGVKHLRGIGMMLGIELERPCKEVMNIGLEHGVIVNVTADKVVRLLPPLILSDTEADQIVDKVATSVRTFLAAA